MFGGGNRGWATALLGVDLLRRQQGIRERENNVRMEGECTVIKRTHINKITRFSGFGGNIGETPAAVHVY